MAELDTIMSRTLPIYAKRTRKQLIAVT
jgi:hypothetical protein